MNLEAKKRMAAKVLKVGVNRVRFDSENLDRITDAITRESIRRLIKDHVIWAAPKKGVSRSRIKKRKQRAGSRKGAKGARQGKKEKWMRRVRSLRRYLKSAKNRGNITHRLFNRLYAQVKGGQIKTLRHLKEILRQESVR